MTIVVGMTALTPSVHAIPTTVIVCLGEFVTKEVADCVKWREWDELLVVSKLVCSLVSPIGLWFFVWFKL